MDIFERHRQLITNVPPEILARSHTVSPEVARLNEEIRELNKTTWREQIGEEMERHGDNWENVVYCAVESEGPLEEYLDRRWYYGDDDPGFTLWTQTRVYFPAEYDGANWCASVPRGPVSVATRPIGGSA